MIKKRKEHTILVEKYRPQNLEEYICSPDLKLNIQEWIDNKDIPHLLFYGLQGGGKTTLAKILVNNIDCDYLYINATDERSMDVMRDKVKSFASSASFKPLKVVILDEADYILNASQAMLRNLIETYSLNTRFILTCNYLDRIIDPLKSRFEKYKIVPPSKGDIAKRLTEILDIENIEWNKDDVVEIVNLHYPDIRQIITETNANTRNKKFILNRSELIESNYMFKVVELLKSPTYKTFNEIRQIIANSNTRDFEALYTYLYANMDKFSKDLGMTTIILSEYQYQASFVLDKEINIMACISKLLQK